MGSLAPSPPSLPPGTALSSNPPTLFKPLSIRSLTLANRVFVAPMCTYSATATPGHFTDFHLVHLGAYALRGAALTIIEATAVQPSGRITPLCAGLWSDDHITPLKRIVDFVHGAGGKIGIQLAHAGRKGSTFPPGDRRRVAGEEVGGWTVKGAGSLRWGEGFADSVEMSTAEVEGTVQAFIDAARRAVEAGVDVIEIHAAHGYLLNEFLSPLTNTRKDRYGGSWEGRTRALLEITQSVRAAIPQGMPLFVRISATEWVDGGWDEADSIRLAKLLSGLGVDLLDVSSGGNSEAQRIEMHNGYQVGMAGRIREALRKEGMEMLVGAVGLITEAEIARSIVQVKEGVKEETSTIEIENERGETQKADVVLVARQFLREPEWVFRVAQRLGVEVQWPRAFSRAKWPVDAKI